MPHRAATPVIDVRDCAAAHIAAAENPAAVGSRFLTSSGRAVTRAALLNALRAKYCDFEFCDDGPSPDPSSGRLLLRSKYLHRLGIELRE